MSTAHHDLRFPSISHISCKKFARATKNIPEESEVMHLPHDFNITNQKMTTVSQNDRFEIFQNIGQVYQILPHEKKLPPAPPLMWAHACHWFLIAFLDSETPVDTYVVHRYMHDMATANDDMLTSRFHMKCQCMQLFTLSSMGCGMG